jgi:hypothetical protein
MWHNPLTAAQHSIRPLADLYFGRCLQGLRSLARWTGQVGIAVLTWIPAAWRPARRPPHRMCGAVARRSEAEAEGPLDLERPLGCGWFDSSHDLRAGLQVQEHASPDAVAQELPVEFWLRLHLTEWRGQPSA